MLRSDSCDYSDAYIVVKGNIIVTKKVFTATDFERPNNTNLNATNTNNENNIIFAEKKLVFKNNAPFINCHSKINGIKIDNAEDLDVGMPMYNLLEHIKNYKKNNRYGNIMEILKYVNIIEMNQIVLQIIIT